jgi:hypothetical protein
MIIVFEPGREDLVAHFEANARAVVERIERDPDGRYAALRQAKAEAERTGSRAPIDRFVRRFKAGEFDRASSALDFSSSK